MHRASVRNFHRIMFVWYTQCRHNCPRTHTPRLPVKIPHTNSIKGPSKPWTKLKISMDTVWKLIGMNIITKQKRNRKNEPHGVTHTRTRTNSQNIRIWKSNNDIRAKNILTVSISALFRHFFNYKTFNIAHIYFRMLTVCECLLFSNQPKIHVLFTDPIDTYKHTETHTHTFILYKLHDDTQHIVFRSISIINNTHILRASSVVFVFTMINLLKLDLHVKTQSNS